MHLSNNPLTPRSDSPYIFFLILNSVKQTGNENEENYQLGDLDLILGIYAKFLGLADREMYGVS